MASRRAARPALVFAEMLRLPGSLARRPCSTTGSAESILLTTTSSGTCPAPISASTPRTAAICASGSASDPSTACRMRSASAVSSSVDRNASISWCGRCRTKPTVSVRVNARPEGVSARRTAGSRVANSASSTRTPAPVSTLSRLDLPALVYPAMTTDGTARRRRWPRCTLRPVDMPVMSFCSREIRARSRRRSVSILVSPGPRVPMPPPPATRPPACRDSDSPQPRSLGSMYCSWASSTWALPSRLRACWAKMSSSGGEAPATRRSACRSSRSMFGRSWSPRSGCSLKTVLIVLLVLPRPPDGAMHRPGFHFINTAAASYVPRRLALARQRGAVDQVGEGGLGARAGRGTVRDEALAGLGDVQHLALELQRADQRVVDVLEHRPAHLDRVLGPHPGEPRRQREQLGDQAVDAGFAGVAGV